MDDIHRYIYIYIDIDDVNMYSISFFREGITKCSNEVHDKFTDIRQHNKYLLEYPGYMLTGVSWISIAYSRFDLFWLDSTCVIFCSVPDFTLFTVLNIGIPVSKQHL